MSQASRSSKKSKHASRPLKRQSAASMPSFSERTSMKTSEIQKDSERRSIGRPFLKPPPAPEPVGGDFEQEHEYSFGDVYGHGAFQRMILCTNVLALVVLQCHTQAFKLIARKVDFWCKRPVSFSYLSAEDWKKTGIPAADNETYSRCTVYDQPLSVNRSPVPCDFWEYDTSTATIVTQWDLVCGREWLLSMASSIYMVGAMVAVPVLGVAADSCGRRPIIRSAVVVLQVAGFGSCFNLSFPLFVIFRCIVSACVSTIFVSILTLLIEVTSLENRTLFGTIAVSLGVSIAEALMVFLGQFEMQWWVVQLIIMGITLTLLSAFYTIEESPRWLLAIRDFARAEKCVMWAAQVNHEPSDKVRKGFEKLAVKIQKKSAETVAVKPYVLLRSPLLRSRTYVIFFCWFAMMYSFYGLTFTDAVKTVRWAKVTTPFLAAFATVAMFFAMNSLGRKTVFVTTLGIVGTSTAVLLGTYTSSQLWMNNALVVTGKTAALLSIEVGYIYTAELFPTVVRSAGVCGGYMCGRLGGALALALFSSKHEFSPDVAFGIMVFLVFVSEIALAKLPDTSTRRLLNTMNEMDEEHFYELARAELGMKPLKGSWAPKTAFAQDDAAGRTQSSVTSKSSKSFPKK
ncbi:solute carrier family 22 member 7-like [Ornithodoros turicata]|uniref:solute carrier family 22 member 7-like n=1 Tax=Ornithodoros turicata TaxID=34597 RepID=UPI0031399E32